MRTVVGARLTIQDPKAKDLPPFSSLALSSPFHYGRIGRGDLSRWNGIEKPKGKEEEKICIYKYKPTVCVYYTHTHTHTHRAEFLFSTQKNREEKRNLQQKRERKPLDF
jgi:hypothetical protein